MAAHNNIGKGVIAARVIFILYIAVVLYLCFGHFDSLPKVGRSFMGIEADKLVHFAMFFPFLPLSYLAVGRLYQSPWTAMLLILALLVTGCVLAAGTEIVQGMLTYRSQDARDFRADTISLSCGAVITLIMDIYRRTRK